jgi:hypothetical protein
MKVYITCTLEFSTDKLKEVVALLNNVSGELEFIEGKQLTQSQYKRLNGKFENNSQISSLNFEEYFDLVQGYRELREIEDDDFVILISSIKHTGNWFSAFNKKNIFIHGDEWDLISNVDSKFGIAHQCVENIFQSLIDLDLNNVRAEPNIHMTAIGCINDFCGNKPDILLKLQSANICPSCFKRALDKGLTDYILAHIISILEVIRKEFVISKNFQRQTKLDKVIIDDKGNVMIGHRIIKMDVLPKVMYICFLKNIDGFPTNKLCENKIQFDEIYNIIKKNPDEFAINKMCCNTIRYKDRIERIKPTFETYRSKIRTALKEKLGDTISNYYAVNLTEDQNKQNIFKVPLTEDQFEVDPRFREQTT